MLGRQHLADHAAHRGAHHVSRRDLQPAEQLAGVLRHVGERVLLGSDPAAEHLAHAGRAEVEVGRAPDVPVVEADHVEAPLGQLPAEVLVPGDHLRRQAHDQQNRGVVGVAEALVTEGHAAADVAELFGHPTIVVGEGPRLRPPCSLPPDRFWVAVSQRILHAC